MAEPQHAQVEPEHYEDEVEMEHQEEFQGDVPPQPRGPPHNQSPPQHPGPQHPGHMGGMPQLPPGMMLSPEGVPMLVRPPAPQESFFQRMLRRALPIVLVAVVGLDAVTYIVAAATITTNAVEQPITTTTTNSEYYLPLLR